FMGLSATFSEIILPNLADVDNITGVVYCGLFGLLIILMQGTVVAHAIARLICNKLNSSTVGEGSTTLYSIIYFFDFYFIGLIVGSVMRRVTDRMKVSREKLAYIVDSTSAPMSLLAPVSTWVVFVMGLIGSQFVELNITGSAYLTYITTIPFNFYSILAL